MIGAFAAFGVDFNLSYVAVLAYRGDLLLAANDPRHDRLLPVAPYCGSLARPAELRSLQRPRQLGRSRLTDPLPPRLLTVGTLYFTK